MANFFHYMFFGHPWYMAAVWSNFFIGFIVIPLGWVWSRTRLWPLNELKRRHAEHAEELARLHGKIDMLQESLRVSAASPELIADEAQQRQSADVPSPGRSPESRVR